MKHTYYGSFSGDVEVELGDKRETVYFFKGVRAYISDDKVEELNYKSVEYSYFVDDECEEVEEAIPTGEALEIGESCLCDIILESDKVKWEPIEEDDDRIENMLIDSHY